MKPHRTSAEVLASLEDLRHGDIDWRAGRAFSLAYIASREALDLAESAYRLYAGENALNVEAFPSLRRMQSDVVNFVGGLVNAPDPSAGFFTSGGTESLLTVSYAARQRRPQIVRPNIVLPTSAHAAFEKAASYFGIENRRIDVRSDWRADVDAMADAIDNDTILMVGSAPQYPQGVVDPIAQLGELALDRNVPLHVDSCIGGMVLPFIDHPSAWDFTVPGVSSISVDMHKYGYSAKGAGLILYRNKELRNAQVFVTDNWLGGLYGSSGILGTKSGGPIASAWAMIAYFGHEGYRTLAQRARATTLTLAAAIDGMAPLFVMTKPDSTLLAIGSRDETFDVHAVGDALRRRGWYVDRQTPPASLHMTVSAGHDAFIDAFIADLREAIVECRTGSPPTSGQSSYGTID